jgi:hypothetical protein
VVAAVVGFAPVVVAVVVVTGGFFGGFFEPTRTSRYSPR